MENGTEATDDKQKAELFASHLEQCHKMSDHPHFNQKWREEVETFVNVRPAIFQVKNDDTYDAVEPGDDDDLLQQITINEITTTLQKCKNTSAAGKDGLKYVMIKKSPENILGAISKIFNCLPMPLRYCQKINLFLN